MAKRKIEKWGGMINLRQYQQETLESINWHFENGVNRQLVHIATGGGKTVIFGSLIKQMQRKTLVLAHTLELLDQAKDKINMICPSLDVGLVCGQSKEFDKPVVISTIQSARQPETLTELQKQGFTLCIYDECHRSASRTPREILSALGFLGDMQDKLLVGFSATPFRTDSKGLAEIFEKVVYQKSIKELIELGYLCKPVGIKIKTDLDLSTIQTQNGDFVTESLASYMNTPQMNELVVNAFIEKAQGRNTVAFCVTVDHAQSLAEAFRARGIASEAIHGHAPSEERKALLRKFKEGKISVLTNCQLLTEGWDECSINCVLMARPIQSKGLYQQCVGRGLRLYPNKKDCLILDFGSKSHSLCGVASLTEDQEEAGQKKKPDSLVSDFAKSLPPTINKKLKASIEEFDLLNDSFTWLKDKDGLIYSLKGNGGKLLKIHQTADGRFSAILFNSNTVGKIIARDLSFEYCFAAAEDYAKSNKQLFTLCDLSASWRDLPISDKQKSLFRSHGYRAGIDDLSRGQAAMIISSGILNKKAVRH